eukprot:GHVT01069675.1.p1 GENE.GHVT01069675.1~~GHVT01069675.1.p1  ORF type:complete len:125 (-),score=26.02 GHVT01069675.1:1389-1763(-)
MAGASREGMKELIRAFRWQKALHDVSSVAVASTSSSSAPHKALQRYTNFSLQHVWDKFSPLQSHLLMREYLMPSIAKNPELCDEDLPEKFVSYCRPYQPTHNPIDLPAGVAQAPGNAPTAKNNQ